MAEDEEAKKVKSFDDFKKDIAKLQRDMKSLKNEVSEISEKVFELDNLGLQDQIFRQNDIIEAIRENTLVTSRWLAKSDMNFHQSHMCEILQSKGNRHLIEKVRLEYTKYCTLLITSDLPLTLAGQFKDYCINISNQYNLHAYF